MEKQNFERQNAITVVVAIIASVLLYGAAWWLINNVSASDGGWYRALPIFLAGATAVIGLWKLGDDKSGPEEIRELETQRQIGFVSVATLTIALNWLMLMPAGPAEWPAVVLVVLLAAAYAGVFSLSFQGRHRIHEFKLQGPGLAIGTLAATLMMAALGLATGWTIWHWICTIAKYPNSAIAIGWVWGILSAAFVAIVAIRHIAVTRTDISGSAAGLLSFGKTVLPVVLHNMGVWLPPGFSVVGLIQNYSSVLIWSTKILTYAPDDVTLMRLIDEHGDDVVGTPKPSDTELPAGTSKTLKEVFTEMLEKYVQASKKLEGKKSTPKDYEAYLDAESEYKHFLWVMIHTYRDKVPDIRMEVTVAAQMRIISLYLLFMLLEGTKGLERLLNQNQIDDSRSPVAVFLQSIAEEITASMTVKVLQKKASFNGYMLRIVRRMADSGDHPEVRRAQESEQAFGSAVLWNCLGLIGFSILEVVYKNQKVIEAEEEVAVESREMVSDTTEAATLTETAKIFGSAEEGLGLDPIRAGIFALAEATLDKILKKFPNRS